VLTEGHKWKEGDIVWRDYDFFNKEVDGDFYIYIPGVHYTPSKEKATPVIWLPRLDQLVRMYLCGQDHHLAYEEGEWCIMGFHFREETDIASGPTPELAILRAKYGKLRE